MKNLTKITSAVLIGSVLMSSSILANTQSQQTKNQYISTLNTPTTQVKHANFKNTMRLKKQYMKHKYKRNKWNLGLRHSLKLTQPQATTITRAALIMQGFKRLHVGDVKVFKGKKGFSGYLVEIKNKKNKTIRHVVVNANNGHIRPLGHQQFKRMKLLMQKQP